MYPCYMLFKSSPKVASARSLAACPPVNLNSREEVMNCQSSARASSDQCLHIDHVRADLSSSCALGRFEWNNLNRSRFRRRGLFCSKLLHSTVPCFQFRWSIHQAQSRCALISRQQFDCQSPKSEPIYRLIRNATAEGGVGTVTRRALEALNLSLKAPKTYAAHSNICAARLGFGGA